MVMVKHTYTQSKEKRTQTFIFIGTIINIQKLMLLYDIRANFMCKHKVIFLHTHTRILTHTHWISYALQIFKTSTTIHDCFSQLSTWIFPSMQFNLFENNIDASDVLCPTNLITKIIFCCFLSSLFSLASPVYY